MQDARRRELLELLLRVSFKRGRVTLAGGRVSDFYVDLRQTLMRPRGVALAGELVLERLEAGPRVDAVGGMAVGAVPLVTAVLAAAAARDPATPLLGFFVRKQAKQYGLGRRIEGAFAPGQSVALLEDTVTTGAATLEAAAAVAETGGKVARVICLMDRGEGAAEAFAARGLPFEPIFTREDLPL